MHIGRPEDLIVPQNALSPVQMGHDHGLIVNATAFDSLPVHLVLSREASVRFKADDLLSLKVVY